MENEEDKRGRGSVPALPGYFNRSASSIATIVYNGAEDA